MLITEAAVADEAEMLITGIEVRAKPGDHIIYSLQQKLDIQSRFANSNVGKRVP